MSEHRPDEPVAEDQSAPGTVRPLFSCRRFVDRYRRLPEKLRIIGTALAGVAIGYVTYAIVYAVLPFEPRATASWVIAFLIGVARQHAMHRWLTFSRRPPYFSSLARAYVLDSAVLAASTLLNWVLTRFWGINHRVAWFVCLLTSGLLGLIFLKRFVFAIPPRCRRG